MEMQPFDNEKIAIAARYVDRPLPDSLDIVVDVRTVPRHVLNTFEAAVFTCIPESPHGPPGVGICRGVDIFLAKRPQRRLKASEARCDLIAIRRAQ